jgi:2,4-dienoyl-CoA reductase-like NADH-dependent reductase (Old Yellow Enzyme family)
MAKTKFAVKSMVADELTTVRSEIKTLQARAKFLLEIVKDERAAAKNTMVSIRAAKVAKLEEKRAERIQKLEAKLLALKSPKVGIAAKKAARKPSKVQITKVA